MSLSCPRCRGKAYGGRGCLIWVLIIGLFPLGLIFLLCKGTYRCRTCGYKFKA